jgi:hypothetical protein
MHESERNAMEALTWAALLHEMEDDRALWGPGMWRARERHYALLYNSRRFKRFAKRFSGSPIWAPSARDLENRAIIALESSKSPDNPFGDPSFIQRVILEGKAPARHERKSPREPLYPSAP